MNVVVWSNAVAGGGVLGGALLGQWGTSAFPGVLLALLLISLTITFRAREHGFPQGQRDSTRVIHSH